MHELFAGCGGTTLAHAHACALHVRVLSSPLPYTSWRGLRMDVSTIHERPNFSTMCNVRRIRTNFVVPIVIYFCLRNCSIRHALQSAHHFSACGLPCSLSLSHSPLTRSNGSDWISARYSPAIDQKSLIIPLECGAPQSGQFGRNAANK